MLRSYLNTSRDLHSIASLYLLNIMVMKRHLNYLKRNSPKYSSNTRCKTNMRHALSLVKVITLWCLSWSNCTQRNCSQQSASRRRSWGRSKMVWDQFSMRYALWEPYRHILRLLISMKSMRAIIIST